jgi:DNA polymerase IV
MPVDLTGWPTIYVLPVHLPTDEVHELEENLIEAGATVTYDISEARLVLGAVNSAKRARFELQSRRVHVEQVHQSIEATGTQDSGSPAKKRRRISPQQNKGISSPPVLHDDVSTTDSETEKGDNPEDEATAKSMSQLTVSHDSPESIDLFYDIIEPSDTSFIPVLPPNYLKVAKIQWLRDSLQSGQVKQIDEYVVYEGQIPTKQETPESMSSTSDNSPKNKLDAIPSTAKEENRGSDILSRAQADDQPAKARYGRREQVNNAMRRDFEGRSFASSGAQKKTNGTSRPVHLLRETTSEHDEGVSRALPEMPDWVKENRLYACQRSTPRITPNDDFIAQLKKIKIARLLTADEIGVRAYSTCIASLAAYPYKLSSTKEILALPGCEQKIAHLFHEWDTTGRIKAVDELEADPVLNIIKTFYEIYGVGATTARQFYYDYGWKDLDDVIQEGWDLLSRVQQIGLKYYDDFQLKIPRSEVEFIASIVTYHAKRLVDDGIETIIVGGYRRGAIENGDVDIILSHREESRTKHLIESVVQVLAGSGWIKHVLSITTRNSDRDQQPVAYKFLDDKKPGSGFDTLDKALVVWQDPNWPSRTTDLEANPEAKNPNPHRRVDIIVSPWRTVGCGVAGWTSGTTFQRDLRRYAKNVKNWKFDSSGVRERGTGKWLDLEKWLDPNTRAKTWLEAEKRVFEGMGLEWRDPTERNTG